MDSIKQIGKDDLNAWGDLGAPKGKSGKARGFRERVQVKL